MFNYYQHLNKSIGIGASDKCEIRNRLINTLIIGNFANNAGNKVKVEWFHSKGSEILVNDLVPNDVEQIQSAFDNSKISGAHQLYIGNIVLTGQDVIVVTITNANAAAQTYQVLSAFNPKHSKFGTPIKYSRSIIANNSFNNVVFVSHTNLSVQTKLRFDNFETILDSASIPLLSGLFNYDEANVLYCGDVCKFEYELLAADADVYFVIGQAMPVPANALSYGKELVRLSEDKSNLVSTPEMFGYGKEQIQSAKSRVYAVSDSQID